ncbi:MAG: ATP-binding cassette domain-containing protein, partial [Cellvibrionaceae bacterium]|nr:ATP-binding cassette domain-containing protein [Cellvibrionaceae bacterium]
MSQASSALETLAYAILPICATVVIFVGALEVMAQSMTAGQLVAVMILVWRAIGPLQKSLLLFPKFGDLRKTVSQLDKLMQLPERRDDQHAALLPERSEELTMHNVMLRYPNATSAVLAGVTLTFPSSGFISVTGPSGSGKTSLMRLLSGQIAPQIGNIRYGPIKLSQL